MEQLADVLVPANEEGTRATVLRWCKQVGDTVVKDEPLVELETDKVTVEIPAPADGTLVEVLKQVDAEVLPDEVLGALESRRRSRRATRHGTPAGSGSGKRRAGRATAPRASRARPGARPRHARR